MKTGLYPPAGAAAALHAPPSAAEPLRERAYRGLHAAVFQQLLAQVETRGPLLDLACGTGAWLARLRQAGFTDVLGMDRSSEDFGLERSIYRQANLDQPFSNKLERRFDVITAIEIIEHLESPTAFLREARQLIKSGGYMFVTTPNVECIQGRLRFLLQGKLRAFEDDDSADPTHISPLLTSLLPRLAERSGWRIQERVPLLTNTSRRSVRLLCRVLDPLLKGHAKQGDCHLFILRPVEQQGT